jgi:hypothetical protein
MRLVIVVSILLATFALPAVLSGQTSIWAESQNQVTLSTADMAPQINVSAGSVVSKKLGIFLWALQSESWGEIYVGPSYKFVKGVEVGVGVGIESDPKPLRSAVYALFSGNGRSLYMTAETGGSGPWYQVEGNQAFNLMHQPAGIGFRYQSFIGIGPRLEATTLKGHLMVWVVPIAIDFENNNSQNMLFGIRLIQ